MKYTKKQIDEATSISEVISKRIHNLIMDRLELIDVVEDIRNIAVKKQVRELLKTTYESLNQVREIIKGVK